MTEIWKNIQKYKEEEDTQEITEVNDHLETNLLIESM
jgi:hypothetical protein